jgi:hypothetical protein
MKDCLLLLLLVWKPLDCDACHPLFQYLRAVTLISYGEKKNAKKPKKAS